MLYLKQSTAVSARIGPFVDKTDGVTEETGLAAEGTEISKNHGAFATGPVLGTHDAEGWYPIDLTTTHTNTLGPLVVKCHDSAVHLPVWLEFMVLSANVYDSLVGGSDLLDVSLVQVAGSTTNVAALATNVDAILTDTADMQPKLGTPAGASMSADIAAIKSDTAAILTDTGTTLDAAIAAVKADTAAILIDTGTTLDAALAVVDANVDAILVDTADMQPKLGTPAGASMSADIAAVKVDTAAILVDTGTTLDAALAVVDANVDAILVDTGTTLDAAIAAVKSDTAAILVDTGTTLDARIPAALTAGGNMKSDALAIDGSTTAADRLQRSAESIVFCTVGAASTTTSIVTSAMDPSAAVTDQFKGRIVIFDKATTTANLRGQATDITASTSAGVLTVTALTDAPVSGDTFTIT